MNWRASRNPWDVGQPEHFTWLPSFSAEVESCLLATYYRHAGSRPPIDEGDASMLRLHSWSVAMPALALCCALLGLAPSAPSADEKSAPIRALLVIGGCCHDYAKQKDLLTQGISARARVKWTIAYDPDTTTKHKN